LAEPLHCGPLSGAPLLPKLRGHFAEFLNKGSPVRLGILYPSTCVGFWYGRLLRLHMSFLGSRYLPLPAFARLRGLSPLVTVIHCNGWLSLDRTCTPTTGNGILTVCPSPTLLSLGLGPTNPTRTDLPSETLEVRRSWFSHDLRYSCLHSHSCALQRTFRYAFSARRTLPYHVFRHSSLRCHA
jgi:hypothetical protein